MVRLMALGHPVEGLSWAETQADPTSATGLAYCSGANEGEWQRGRELRLTNRDKFHFHGHGTEQEAIACYQNFLRDFNERELV